MVSGVLRGSFCYIKPVFPFIQWRSRLLLFYRLIVKGLLASLESQALEQRTAAGCEATAGRGVEDGASEEAERIANCGTADLVDTALDVATRWRQYFYSI